MFISLPLSQNPRDLLDSRQNRVSPPVKYAPSTSCVPPVMTAVTVRKEDRLPLYLGGKVIVYNAKSLNKYDEAGGSRRSKKTYSRGRISIVLIICYIIFLFCCLLLCLFLNLRLFCLFSHSSTPDPSLSGKHTSFLRSVNTLQA